MNLGAFGTKATGTSKSLAVLTMVGLADPVSSKSRFAGLTGPKPEERTTWIHVGYEGEWEGHPSGPFALSASDFKACTLAMAARQTPPQVDYGHGSLYEGDGLPKPAAGYVLGVEVRGDDLWAEVEFTERAASMIKAGEYRFCSGVFVWDAAHAKSGEPVPCQLDSIGLTNRPFVDGQQAIRLSQVVLGSTMDFKKADIITKLDALVDGDTVSEAQLAALVKFLSDSTKKPEAPEAEEAELAAKPECAPLAAPVVAATAPAAAPLASPPEVPAPPAPVAPEMDVAGMVLTKLAELTGLANADLLASIETNADQIKAALLGGDGGALPYSALATKVELQDTTIAALSSELSGYRAEKAKAADDALVAEVETLVLSGKAHPASREKWMSMARKSPAEFRALSASLPVAFPLGKDAPPATATGGGESLTSISAENIPETHPTYVALAAQLGDPKSPYASMFPSEAGARKAAIDRAVRNHIRTSQPISG